MESKDGQVIRIPRCHQIPCNTYEVQGSNAAQESLHFWAWT